MPKTTSQLSEFTVVETIGSGSFGTCRKIARKSDGKVVIKFILNATTCKSVWP